MKPQTIFQLLVLTATIISVSSHGQTKNNKLLDVYKVDFDYYIDSADTGLKQKDKDFQWPLLVYAHSEYLYAEDIEENNKTIWQINYPTKELMQLNGKTAYPMNFDGFLSTDVLGTEETVGNRTSGYGTLILSNDTMTVAGYLCRQAVIRYWTKEGRVDNEAGETSVWYCPQLPRFYLPGYEYLQKIPGMALQIWYDWAHRERKGIVAKTVLKQKKPASFFKLPKGTFIMYPPKAN